MYSYHDELAELKDLRELAAHSVLQVFRFRLRHLAEWEVKHFLGEQFQHNHVILTERLVGSRGADDVRNEGGPVLGPLVLEDLYKAASCARFYNRIYEQEVIGAHLNEDHVELPEIDFLTVSDLGLGACLDYKSYNILFNPFALLPW